MKKLQLWLTSRFPLETLDIKEMKVIRGRDGSIQDDDYPIETVPSKNIDVQINRMLTVDMLLKQKRFLFFKISAR